jgi:hypothetical protein
MKITIVVGAVASSGCKSRTLVRTCDALVPDAVSTRFAITAIAASRSSNFVRKAVFPGLLTPVWDERVTAYHTRMPVPSFSARLTLKLRLDVDHSNTVSRTFRRIEQ